MACATAKATLELISKPELLANVRDRGAQLVAGLHKLNDRYQLFGQVRGLGLLVGAELNATYQGKAKAFVNKALAQGLLLLVAGPDVLRFAPSLAISQAEVALGLELLEKGIIETLKEL